MANCPFILSFHAGAEEWKANKANYPSKCYVVSVWYNYSLLPSLLLHNTSLKQLIDITDIATLLCMTLEPSLSPSDLLL